MPPHTATAAATPPAPLPLPLLLLAVLAAAAPSLLAYSVSPSPTFLNQALALGLWALFVAWVQPWRSGAAAWRATGPALAALGLMAAAVLWSWGPGALPASLALSALGLLAMAALLLAAGAGMRARPDAELVFAAFCAGLAVAGLANVLLALLQVFAPHWADGTWLARPGTPGRAVGNLRQPNHLSSLLTWGCIGVLALLELRRLRLRWAAPLLAALVVAIVLTASRTGVLSLLLLALWGLLDKRLARPTRALLLAGPLVYALAWGALAAWAQAAEQAFSGAARLAETDISSSRFGIWANTLALLRQQPWAGVGWGEFNLAWTLTPFPGRPTAFFDHTHNLPLQLLVELGLLLGGAVLGLLLWALGRGFWDAWGVGRAAGAAAATPAGAIHLARRCALMLVLMIGLHSLLEYPLWYAYFLLPAAWAWGFALPPAGDGAATALAAAEAAAPTPAPGRPAGLLVAAALAALLATGYSVLDYQRVASIFVAREGSAPLQQRIAQGQRSLFFAHHADYAAATVGPGEPASPAALAAQLAAFDRAAHYLLDTRLMRQWAEALHAAGREDAARHLAQRLREFRKAEAEDFFAPCADAALPAYARPFQCQAPGAPLPWRAFLPGG